MIIIRGKRILIIIIMFVVFKNVSLLTPRPIERISHFKSEIKLTALGCTQSTHNQKFF